MHPSLVINSYALQLTQEDPSVRKGLEDNPCPSAGQIPDRAIGESARKIAHMSHIKASPLRHLLRHQAMWEKEIKHVTLVILCLSMLL